MSKPTIGELREKLGIIWRNEGYTYADEYSHILDAITELGELRERSMPNPLEMIESQLKGLSGDVRKAKVTECLLRLGNLKTVATLQAKLEKAMGGLNVLVDEHKSRFCQPCSCSICKFVREEEV